MHWTGFMPGPGLARPPGLLREGPGEEGEKRRYFPGAGAAPRLTERRVGSPRLGLATFFPAPRLPGTGSTLGDRTLSPTEGHSSYVRLRDPDGRRAGGAGLAALLGAGAQRVGVSQQDVPYVAATPPPFTPPLAYLAHVPNRAAASHAQRGGRGHGGHVSGTGKWERCRALSILSTGDSLWCQGSQVLESFLGTRSRTEARALLTDTNALGAGSSRLGDGRRAASIRRNFNLWLLSFWVPGRNPLQILHRSFWCASPRHLRYKANEALGERTLVSRRRWIPATVIGSKKELRRWRIGRPLYGALWTHDSRGLQNQPYSCRENFLN